MIRITQADRSNWDQIIGLLAGYFGESTYGAHVTHAVDSAHARRILHQVQHLGHIWLAWSDSELIGAIAGVREPNVWFPNKIAIREMFWYVQRGHRHTTAGARLFRAYQAWAEQELNTGAAEAYFISNMSTTSPIDFERRGFRIAEQLYIKD